MLKQNDEINRSSKTPPKRPNILWIMTDQQKSTALSCGGGPNDLTPNLDRLAQDGIRFSNAYTPCPVCAPARASMKTGCYPPATGVVGNWLGFKDGVKFLPQRLQEAGYRTGMVGKLHFYPPEPDYGFEQKHLSDAPYSVYADDDKHSEYIKWLKASYFDKKGLDPVALFDKDELAYDTDVRRFVMGSSFRTVEEHETAWTTQCAVDFLDEQSSAQPFFAYVSYFGPHQPYGPPPPYDKWISPEQVHLPDSYYTNFMENSPVFKASCARIREHLMHELTAEDYKSLIAAYYGQMKMIDDSIGGLLRHLKERGLYDNTMIIFSSDHGDYLGDYGMLFKGQMYDSCAKVPLIIKPDNVSGAVRVGAVSHEIVNTIDLYATVLEAVGDFDWKTDVTESRSLHPLLAYQDSTWDNKTYSIIGETLEQVQCMLRQGDYKLLRQATGTNSAVYELYNLADNPQETVNLYNNADYASVCSELQNSLDSWFACQAKRYPKTPVHLGK